MQFSQQELNEKWKALQGKTPTVYDDTTITENSDLVHGMQIDVPISSGSREGGSTTLSFTRRRDSPDAEWGDWEDGFSAQF